MLCKNIDASAYISEFKKRFSNFCEKSPILLSYIVTGDSVKVVIEETDDIITFPIQYTIDVKSFIYGIRQVLIKRAYPVLEHTTVVNREITEEERQEFIERGVHIESIPSTIEDTVVTNYLIDRVIIYKDIFILKNLSNGKLYKYKLNKSSVFFLKKLRAKNSPAKFASAKDSADFFFRNSELISEIVGTQKEE